MLSRRQFIAGSSVALYACRGFHEHVPDHFEIVVQRSIDHLLKKEFDVAEQELEKNKDPYYKDMGYFALYGFAQACNGSLKKAEDTFRKLIDFFEADPTMIFTVRDRLRPLFPRLKEENVYTVKRKELRSAAVLLHDLSAVDAFLSLAELKPIEAQQAFERILPKYKYKCSLYQNMMDKLAKDSKTRGDMLAEHCYSQMKAFFEDWKPAK
jgi:hypothetical protein